MNMFSAALSMHRVWEVMLPDTKPPSSSADCVCCRADQGDGGGRGCPPRLVGSPRILATTHVPGAAYSPLYSRED